MTARARVIVMALPALVPALATVVAAHDLEVAHELVAGRLRIEVFFPPRTPVAGARVTVAAVGGEGLAEGVTDDAGAFECAVPGGVDEVSIEVRHAAHHAVLTAAAGSRRDVPGLAERLWKIPAGVLLIIALFLTAKVFLSKRSGDESAERAP